MSSNNNTSPEAMVGVFVLVAIGMAAMAIAALFAFFAVALTIVAVVAWGGPVTIFGETIEPEDARAYIIRGAIGAVVAPTFVIFSCALFQLEMDKITDHGWILISFGGYCLGSLGIEILIDQAREEAEAAAALQQEILPPLPAPQPKPTQTQSAKPAEDFEFARWDDEEIEQ